MNFFLLVAICVHAKTSMQCNIQPTSSGSATIYIYIYYIKPQKRHLPGSLDEFGVESQGTGHKLKILRAKTACSHRLFSRQHLSSNPSLQILHHPPNPPPLVCYILVIEIHPSIKLPCERNSIIRFY